MNQARWRLVERVLDVVLDNDSGRWPAILDEECGEDLELRREVETLLQQYTSAGRFLGSPPALAAAALVAAAELESLKQLLADRYRVEREVGRGGMATVYLGHDLRHDRPVALKVLRSELAAALGAERFLREIALAARLDHPHIVPLLDSGEAGGFLYYVMPYVQGESLRDRLNRERQLPVEDALEIVRETADALQYAHSLGVVHRDVKPENILLTGGHARLADFGIARAMTVAGSESLTATGLAIGTPAYMSPEQASGEGGVDARTDVYGLGCVLYEMLAGQPPYTGATAEAILARKRSEPPGSITGVRPTVAPELEAAILKSLARVPADRYSTAWQFAQALEQIGTTPATSVPMPLRRPGRRAVLSAVAALLAMLVLGVGLNVAGLRDAVARRAGGAAVAARAQRSVAVLPFENVGGNPGEEYFSDGLTEELIAALSQVRSLRVAARTSSFAFKGRAQDVREVSRALNVATVLVGSVRQAGQRVRITAQLIDASSGLGLWSQTYDERALSDIFDIQADLALRIARALEANLTPSERGRLARKPTENLEAYNLYLKGRFAFNQRGEGLFTAIEYFQQAIAVDSQYAQAWAGLASTYPPLGVTGYIQPQEGRERMRVAAQRAVELDDDLAEVHNVLGAYYHVYHWDWDAAEREYRRALELDPNYPTTYLWYGFFLETMGRFDEGLAIRRRVEDLDPLAPGAPLGFILRRMGRYDLAETAFLDAIALHPSHWQAHEGLGEVLEATGRLEEAIRAFERAAVLAGRTSRAKAGLARVLALAGRDREARRLIQELRAEAARSGIYHPTVAAALLAVEGPDAAMEWLEAAYGQRHPDLVEVNVDRRYGELRSDSRFQDLLRRVGFPGAPVSP